MDYVNFDVDGKIFIEMFSLPISKLFLEFGNIFILILSFSVRV